MDDLDYIKIFLKNNYLDLLLHKNITIVNIPMSKNITYLVYKDEIFIFESHRSLNQAYIFYNINNTVCLEGMEYYKITRNYENYLNKDDINIKNGKVIKCNKKNYLINYFTKGYKNKKTLSLNNINKNLEPLVEYCSLLIENDVQTTTSNEYTSVVTINKENDYKVDFYIIDSIEPVNTTYKYRKNKSLNEIVTNRTHNTSQVKTGIFFIDGYKDCFSLETNKTGCFIYYAVENEPIYIKKYDTISKEEIYNFYTMILEEDELPISLITDNEFLYDILNKSFDKKIDFILDKSNRHCRVITELSLALTLNNYDEYNIDAFCMILENNFNAISNYIDQMQQYDFEKMLEDCINAYIINENEIDEDEYFLDDEEEYEDEDGFVGIDVDTKYLS